MSQIKRADWVTCGDSSAIGLVKRLAKDGSWADVEWPTCTKRMQTSVLQPHATIQRSDGWTITDIMRELELTQGSPTARCVSCGGDYTEKDLVALGDGSGEYRCKGCHEDVMREQELKDE